MPCRATEVSVNFPVYHVSLRERHTYCIPYRRCGSLLTIFYLCSMTGIGYLSYDVHILPNVTIKNTFRYGGENLHIFLEILCIWLLFIFIATSYVKKNHGKVSLSVIMEIDKLKKAVLIFSSLIICLVLIPLALLASLPLMVLRLLVYFILKIKYGKTFGGLLEGADVIWAIEDVSRSISNALFIVKSEDSCDDFFQSVKTTIYEKFFHNPENFPKLLSIKVKSFGYYFYLKHKFTFVDCIKPIVIDKEHEEISEATLQEFVSQHLNETMPKNHEGLWQVLVIMNKIKHRGNNSYPVICRFHHSLADGASLLRVLVECLADNVPGQILEMSEHNSYSRRSSFKNKEEIQQPPKEYDPHNVSFRMQRIVERITTKSFFIWIEYLQQRCSAIMSIFTAPLDVIVENTTRKRDDNVLHGPRLSGDKLAIWKLESTPEYVPLLKRIKAKLGCYRFSDILLAAISGSFSEFYEKYSDCPPENVSVVLPVIEINEFKRKNNEEPNENSLSLKNSFRVGLLNLPICMKDWEQPSTETENRLEEVKKQTDLLRNSKSFRINYCIMNVISTVLPVSILAPLLQKAAHCTLVVSSMPGTHKLTVFRNKELLDVVCFVPNKGSSGLSLAVLTYEGRFQIGLTVDKALISETEKAQELVDGIFRYLLKMGKEIEYENITHNKTSSDWHCNEIE